MQEELINQMFYKKHLILEKTAIFKTKSCFFQYIDRKHQGILERAS
ncbi:MAG: hypothetical protein KR126chlam2_00556 [Chlamydiae bacterium]|nr:hypothetical protein [Chlamydiota bacterium]